MGPQLAQLPPGQLVAGRYRIEAPLGASGVGALYQAVDLSNGKRCLLKLVRPELARDPAATARLLEEARVTGRVAADLQVVGVFDSGEDRALGAPYLAMLQPAAGALLSAGGHPNPPVDATAPTMVDGAAPFSGAYGMPSYTMPGAPFPGGGYPNAPPMLGGLPPQRSQSYGMLWLLLGGGALGFVVIAGALAWVLLSPDRSDTSAEPERESRSSGSRSEEKSSRCAHETAAVPVFATDPSLGNCTAPVTVVEFGDFQCPFCKRVHATVEQLQQRYGAEQLRVVWKHNPLAFHKNALPAHQAGASVFRRGGADRYWKFHALVFQRQGELAGADFGAWARETGDLFFDVSEADRAKISEDLALGERLGVRGTPQFFVNGLPLNGAQPVEKFTEVIDAELGAAKAALAGGTKPEQIYIQRSAKNFQKPASKTSSDKTADTTTVWKVPVDEADPVRGPRHALVTLVEISDFQCPFCARVQSTLAELRQKNEGKLRLVWKDNPLPFHKRAEPAAELARDAFAQRGSEGFFTLHDLLFANQKALEDADLARYAQQTKLDVTRAMSAVSARRHASAIEGSQALATRLGARGTPTFFVNGRRLTGAQPLEKFQTIVDEEIARGERLVRQGVPLERLYEELIKNGRERE